MESISRRAFAGMGMGLMGAVAASTVLGGTAQAAEGKQAAGAASAAADAGASAAAEKPAAASAAADGTDPALVFELSDPSAYWGKNVAAPHTTRESAYANVLPEYEDMADSDVLAEVKAVTPLDEIKDVKLSDGTTVPAVYVKLRNHINRIGGGIGSVPTETSWQMLMYLWSEEDAQHEIEMPILEYFDAQQYHALSGRPIDECQEILDDLAMRGMIMRCHRSGHDVYHLLPYINGFWEFNELRAYLGNGGDNTKPSGDQALAAAAEFDMQGIGGSDPGASFATEVPLFHTYPVSADVVEEDELAPYFDWKAIIKANEKITVSPCQCRLMWASLGAPMCHGDGEHPFETCLSFGELAEYFDEVGIGRYISQDEAIQMVEKCMDAGMVPESLSMKDVDIMCMCHGDCCGNLSSWKAQRGVGAANVNVSAYLLKYDKETCIQCGACIDRCPMEAISFGDDGYCLHNNTCVRCGQCVTVCPVQARVLSARTDYPELGRDYVDAVENLAKARMRRGMIVDFVGGEVPPAAPKA
ncbi:4Fe-4S binding protein [bacterium]|nr:4Fe-4S binding protein [bacterium]